LALRFCRTGLKSRNLILIDVQGDGNCFFRAVSLILTGDENSHFLLRQAAVAVMKQNKFHFHPFLIASGMTWEIFIQKASEVGNFATNLEVQALSIYLNAAISVYVYDPESSDSVGTNTWKIDVAAADSISLTGLVSVTELLPFATPPEEDTLAVS
jgi:hypothetical protein